MFIPDFRIWKTRFRGWTDPEKNKKNDLQRFDTLQVIIICNGVNSEKASLPLVTFHTRNLFFSFLPLKTQIFRSSFPAMKSSSFAGIFLFRVFFASRSFLFLQFCSDALLWFLSAGSAISFNKNRLLILKSAGISTLFLRSVGDPDIFFFYFFSILNRGIFFSNNRRRINCFISHTVRSRILHRPDRFFCFPLFPCKALLEALYFVVSFLSL